jgi:hypothetical protein
VIEATQFSSRQKKKKAKKKPSNQMRKKNRPSKFESAHTIQPTSNVPDQDHPAQ